MAGGLLADANPVRRARDDRFNRSAFARTVAAIVGARRNTGLVVVGIEAPWGEGKSSVLGMAAEQLTKQGRNRQVTVSAWRTTSQDQFIANLAYALATAVRRDWRLASLQIGWARLYRQSLPVQIAIFTPLLYMCALVLVPEVRGWTRAIVDDPKKFAEGLGLFGLPLIALLFSKASQPALEGIRVMLGNTKADAIGSLERFAFDFDVLAAAQRPGSRFVVLVEDLDRCQPSHVLDVLSAIAQIEGHPKADRIAFILAYDRPKLVTSISGALKKDDAKKDADALADDFLDKIVQLEIPLPSAVRTAAAPKREWSIPRLPTILHGVLTSFAFVSLAVGLVTAGSLSTISLRLGGAVLGFMVLEAVIRLLFRSKVAETVPGDWQEAVEQIQPWIDPLPLRGQTRVLNRAAAALILRSETGLTTWEALSVAALATRWPGSFSPTLLAPAIGHGPLDIGKAFQKAEVTEVIRDMETKALPIGHFTDARKLHSVLTSFKR
jgi:hypothetical protein